MEVKLDSCPFCGSDDIDPSFARGYQAGNLSQPIIAAGCMDCGASGKGVNVPDHSTGYAEAADAWNSRVPSDLEIVQKALAKTRASLSVNNGDFIVEAFESCGGNTVAVIDSAIFENAESLLTWAKQTIGDKS